MDILQIIKDYNGVFQLASITIVPFVVLLFTKKYQKSLLKHQAKQDLFFKLMENRGKMQLTTDWADALNKIDVVFQEHEKVREAWRDYYDSLDGTSPHFKSNYSFLLDLLSEMAAVLKYNSLRQTEIMRFYNPQQFHDLAASRDLLVQENLRVLLRSDGLGAQKKKKDYLTHLEKQMKTVKSAEMYQFLMTLKLDIEKNEKD